MGNTDERVDRRARLAPSGASGNLDHDLLAGIEYTHLNLG